MGKIIIVHKVNKFCKLLDYGGILIYLRKGIEGRGFNLRSQEGFFSNRGKKEKIGEEI